MKRLRALAVSVVGVAAPAAGRTTARRRRARSLRNNINSKTHDTSVYTIHVV